MKLLKKILAHLLIVLILEPTKGMSASKDNYEQNSKIKFALFSAAWGENTRDKLRIVAFNQSLSTVELKSIDFIDLPEESKKITLVFDLQILPGKYAEAEISLPDLLNGDACVNRSIEQNWKLAEISNYTLNPSVRNLIIENTDSFRIYQCIRSVNVFLLDPAVGETTVYDEWILYHFESRMDD
jgi:hypothetical protein